MNASKLERVRGLYGTIRDPKRLSLFVEVTMSTGMDRSMFGISGTKRIRKKRLKRMLRRAAFEELIGLVQEIRDGHV